MNIHIAPFLPVTVLVAVVVIYGLLTVYYYSRFRGILAQRYWTLLLVMKLLAVVVVVLALLNPYVLRETPDDRTFRIAVLVDATASMDTRDCDTETRLERVKSAVLAPDSPFYQRLTSQYANLRFHLFAGDETRRVEPGASFNSLPGETDVDGALAALLKSAGQQVEMGAVLLVTDGLDNKGQPLMEAGRLFAKAEIPIHCIGVGDRRPQADIGVTWTTVPQHGVKGKALTLQATVTRNFNTEFNAVVSLTEDGRVIATQRRTFAEGETQTEVSFEHTPFTAGFKAYKVDVEPLDGENNILNNADFAGFEIKNPDQFKIFYFNANLDWEFKFLRQLADKQEKLQLDAVIRLGQDAYFVRGFGEDDENGEQKPHGWPSSASLNEYDCLLINVNSLYLLTADELDTLLNFVENRGGGVVFTGMSEKVPEAIANMLPMVEFPDGVQTAQRSPVEFRPSQVFSRIEAGTLRQLSHKLYVPDGAALYPFEKESTKPGAVAVVQGKVPPWTLLATQNYGAGKIAFMNLSDSWKWVMEQESGDRYYGLFWGHLVSWVSSSSKERLAIRPPSSKLLLQREHEFYVDVLNERFVPDNGAAVSARIRTPGKEEVELKLFADPKVDGRYHGKFLPRELGEHRFYVTAQPSQGKVMEGVADYLVVDLSPESQPHPLAEGQLQSLARQTGGEYWHHTRIDDIASLRLSRKLEFTEERWRFLDAWWFLLAVILAVVPDWVLRRRVGLR